MSDERPIRVLVVDDHPLVLEGLGILLSTAPRVRVVGRAESAAAALQALAVHRPDVTLLDLGLPDMNGVEVIARTRARDPLLRFLVLTASGASEDVHRAVRAGCRGYLLKNTRRDELLRAIERVHEGGVYFPAVIASLLAERPRGAEELTSREREVLELMVAGRRDREIAAALYLGVSTIKSHVRAILAKLEVESRSQAIVAALDLGIVRPREPKPRP